jgi:hypothetical protein
MRPGISAGQSDHAYFFDAAATRNHQMPSRTSRLAIGRPYRPKIKGEGGNGLFEAISHANYCE